MSGMAVISNGTTIISPDVDALKVHLSFTPDMGSTDDALLSRKLYAAQDLVERMLGHTLEERYTEATIPPALREAVLQLAAHWYENREAVSEGLHEVPFGVREIVNAYRDWEF